MSTLVVYADTSDGFINSNDAVYATARAGTGTIVVDDTGTVAKIGQAASPNYIVLEGYESFDTSSLGSSASISAAVLSIYGTLDASGTDFTIQCRLYDWGATLTSADYVAGANLTANTLLAHFATSGFVTSAYNDLVDDAFPANVNKTGTTRVILDSSRTESNTAPTGDEAVLYSSSDAAGTTQDPKLTITYTIPTFVAYVNPMPALIAQ